MVTTYYYYYLYTSKKLQFRAMTKDDMVFLYIAIFIKKNLSLHGLRGYVCDKFLLSLCSNDPYKQLPQCSALPLDDQLQSE